MTNNSGWILSRDEAAEERENKRVPFKQRRKTNPIERFFPVGGNEQRIFKNGIPIVRKTKILSMSPSRTLMTVGQLD